MSVPYYIPIVGSYRIKVFNPEVIPLLLIANWHGEKVSRKNHLKIRHPSRVDPSCNPREAYFYKIIWDDLDDSFRSPYRRARLRMEGSADGVPQVFALLENVDADSVSGSTEGIALTFSPVPFGPNGKPMLGYLVTENWKNFLSTARTALLGDVWTIEGLAIEMSMRYPLLGFSALDVSNYLKLFDKLSVTNLIPSKGPDDKDHHEVKMSPQEFENIFGIKLPTE